jgi:hypothetical protein
VSPLFLQRRKDSEQILWLFEPFGFPAPNWFWDSARMIFVLARKMPLAQDEPGLNGKGVAKVEPIWMP